MVKSDWLAVTNLGTGSVYYANTPTGKSQYEPPAGVVAPKSTAKSNKPGAEDWVRVQNLGSGEVSYANVRRRATQLEKPF